MMDLWLLLLLHPVDELVEAVDIDESDASSESSMEEVAGSSEGGSSALESRWRS